MAQSILDLNRETYLEKAEKNLLQMSDAYFFDKHFKMGDGVDSDKQEFYYQMHRLLCTDDCEMIEFIQDKIEGKLEESCGVKRKPKQTISEVMKITEEYFEDKCCEVISDCSWQVTGW